MGGITKPRLASKKGSSQTAAPARISSSVSWADGCVKQILEITLLASRSLTPIRQRFPSLMADW